MTDLAQFYGSPLTELPGPLALHVEEQAGTSEITRQSATRRAATSADNDPLVVVLDGSKMLTKHDFLYHMSSALQFPSHFGYNWDAFEDALTDLSWLETDSVVLEFQHPEQVLAQSSVDFPIFSSIYHDLFVSQQTRHSSSAGVAADETTAKDIKFLLTSSSTDSVDDISHMWSVEPEFKVYRLS